MYRTLDDLDVKGKRVLVRLDLNVPMKDGKVTDLTRIERQAPTVRELSDKGARVILLSHFDRPGGKRVPEMSLKPVASALANVLGRPVAFAEDCIGPVAEDAVAKLKDGEVLLLENTRFHEGEEKNDPEFVRALAKLGDIYVNDAFSAAHRAHASTEGLAHLLPSAAGRSMEAELSHLTKALEHPAAPADGGGGRRQDLDQDRALENLLGRVDVLVIGGAMANTFLAAEGRPIGRSLAETDQLDTAKRIMAKAQEAGVTILLPSDVVVARAFEANAANRIAGINDVDEDELILDVGPRTIQAFGRQLDKMKTLVWNGPFGAFEMPPFDRGTNAAARAVAERTREGKLLSVAGGGDTVAALAHAGRGGGFQLCLDRGRRVPGMAGRAHAPRRGRAETLRWK